MYLGTEFGSGRWRRVVAGRVSVTCRGQISVVINVIRVVGKVRGRNSHGTCKRKRTRLPISKLVLPIEKQKETVGWNHSFSKDAPGSQHKAATATSPTARAPHPPPRSEYPPDPAI